MSTAKITKVNPPAAARPKRAPAFLNKCLAILSFSLLSSCVPQPKNPVSEPQTCVPPIAPAEVKITTRIEGNKSVGEVWHIKQIHAGPEIRAYHKELEGDLTALIGKYQVKISKFLEENNVKHVFDEGRTEDLTPDNRQEDRLFMANENICRSFFPMGIDESSLRQIVLLGSWLGGLQPNGAEFYAIFHPDVTLHRTFTPENEVVYIIQKQRHGSRKELTFDWRESFAVSEIMSFLDKNPGERAALVFGAGHNKFSDHFASYPQPPVFKTIEFPRVYYDAAKRNPKVMCPFLKKLGIPVGLL